MTYKLACSVVLLAVAAGCSQPARDFLKPPEPAVVWPSAPAAPRIRYLGEFRSSADIQRQRDDQRFWRGLLFGQTRPSPLLSPHAVAVDADARRVAIADTNGACVHVLDLKARTYRRRETWGRQDERFECPSAVAWAGADLWVADSMLHAVAVLPAAGPGRLIGRDLLQRPAGLAYCRMNDRCYVSDAAAHAVFAFDRSGRLVLQFGSRGMGDGELNFPTQIACGPDGTLAVADTLNFRIQRFGPEGSPLGAFGTKGDAAGDFALPKGVAVDADGNVWVVDANFENVQGFTPSGQLLMVFGGEGHGPGEFWLPAGICIDAKRRIWVADTYNQRVQVFELLQ